MAKSKKTEETPKPNIKFVGKGKDGKTDLSLALTSLEEAMRTISLPPQDEQDKPFYHDEARLILKRHSGLYKPVTEKGE